MKDWTAAEKQFPSFTKGWNMKDFIELVGRESGFNPNAKNPKSSARGYNQFLDMTRKTYSNFNHNDPVEQLLAMAQYIKSRYGSPTKALQFWDKNNYY